MRKQNVFDDLGFSPDVAAALHMKSVLHSKIVNYVRVHYSQRQLQELLGEPQPRISDLLRGKISKFSLETLISLVALGVPNFKLRGRKQPPEERAKQSAGLKAWHERQGHHVTS